MARIPIANRSAALLILALLLSLQTPRLAVAWSNNVKNKVVSPTNRQRFSGKICLHATTNTAATAVSYSTLLDGPCWNSLKAALPNILPQTQGGAAVAGHLRVITGTLSKDGSRVVGMGVVGIQDNESTNPNTLALTSGDRLVSDSMATIPSGYTAEQAATTYAFGVTHIYPLMHRVPNVGGSNDQESIVPPKHAVVVGGNEEAVGAAQGLCALGSRVTLVSTQQPKVGNNFDNLLQVTDPSVGPDEEGFAEALGQFDALLDTLGDEQDGSIARLGSRRVVKESTVLRLLRERHGCETYISTCTQAQEIVGREGIFWGPGKIKDYQKGLQARLGQVPLVSAPTGIGSIIQTLLDANIRFSVPKEHKPQASSGAHIRSWDMARFMETTLWPIDNRGTANTRFGFPVLGSLEDDDDDDGEMILELPSLRDQSEQQEEAEAGDAPSQEEHVLRIVGPRGLQTRIVDDQLDCVLFLSAKFCRTCKRLQLPYRRMARLNSQFPQEDLVFARGEASGKDGKLLGKALGVDAVPTFVLFKKGRRFGKALSISKLPSPTLERAIDYLKEDKEWDDAILQDHKDDGKDKRFKL